MKLLLATTKPQFKPPTKRENEAKQFARYV